MMNWIPWWGKQSQRYKELIKEYELIIKGLEEIDRNTFRVKPKITDERYNILNSKYEKIIFKTFSFNELISIIDETDETEINWIIRRWYDQKIHDLLVCLFNFSSLKTKVELEPKHPTVDLYLNNVGFDIKTSNFPIWYSKSMNKEEVLVRFQDLKERRKYYQKEHEIQKRKKRGQNKIYVMFHYDEYEKWWDSRHDIKQIKRTIKDAINNMIIDEVELDGEIVKCGMLLITTSNKDFVANVPGHKLLSN